MGRTETALGGSTMFVKWKEGAWAWLLQFPSHQLRTLNGSSILISSKKGKGHTEQ